MAIVAPGGPTAVVMVVISEVPERGIALREIWRRQFLLRITCLLKRICFTADVEVMRFVLEDSLLESDVPLI